MSDPQSNDIAIVGMAAHLPGARNVSEFWKNLCDGVESVQELTDEELEAAGVSRANLADPRYVKAGVLLQELECFDASFFGFTPKDAAIMDPQHRHFLECCWEALEDAGHVAKSFDGSIGVYAGCGMGAYFMFNLCSNPELVDQVGLFLLRHTGNDKDFLATRVSYEMNLKGPSVNIQTACSTSAVAIHSAAQSLLNGECDMALAGGVTILLPHGRGYPYEENEVLSPDGHCRAFDKDARGTIFGSGAGVVVLRRLEDAIADGDDIRAVIKGSAINNDGLEKVGYLAPSVDGQGDAIAEAIAIAGIDADTISYVEAHGTGTAVGDPIEIAALTQAFRETSAGNGFCRIGSVKTNIGHLDTAAGVASVIKVVEALRHGELPRTLNYSEPNPAIDFSETPFVVNAEHTPWESGAEPRRAGVSSLGVGGTNAHIILEEAPTAEPSPDSRREYKLFCLSGKNKAALQRNAESFAGWLAEHESVNLADVSYTLRVGRVPFERRRVLAAASHEEARTLIESGDPKRVFDASAPTTEREVAFLLPGGGAQYPRMAADLYESEPTYRRVFDECIALCAPELGAELRRWILANEADLEEARERLQHPWLQLPALFITSYATAQVWLKMGVKPVALLGHSLGQNTAACLAGVLSLKDAIGLVSLRGELIRKTAPGAMLSVSLSEDKIRALLTEELCLAAINGPELCAVSGPLASIESFETQLVAESIEFTRIRVSTAGHSHLLDPILPAFRAYLESIELSAPQIPVLCNQSGSWLTAEQATSPEYWTEHLRGTVNFAGNVETLAASGDRVLLEVGPGTVLGSLARMTDSKKFGKCSFGSLRHRDEEVHDQAFLLTTLGRLWSSGVAIDWTRLDEGEARRRVSLPTYSFERQRYWIEPGSGALGKGKLDEATLRKLESIDDWFHAPTWKERERAEVSTSRETWLVFAHEEATSHDFIEQLKQSGQQVTLIRPGKEFARDASGEYRLNPGSREDYGALLDSVMAEGHVPTRVAHLWLVTNSEKTDPTTNFFHLVQERGFYSLLFLAQALADRDFDSPLEIGVVTNNMQALDGESLLHPEKAAVLGPCRVLPREMPNVRCRSIDVELPRTGLFSGGSRKQLAAELHRELTCREEATCVVLRGGSRFVEDITERATLQTGVDRMQSGAVVLVTGGFGGIGLTMADALATRYQAKLVLVGRTRLPDRAHWDGYLVSHAATDPTSRKIRAIRDLEKKGSEVLAMAADVANREEMSAVVAEAKARFGTINGVLHAAGVIEDSVIGMKDPSSVNRVFSPKIHGTLVLEQVLEPYELDFFVLFSSTSSLLGLVGQVDYTAANAFLNAFARSRNLDGTGPVVAIDWGIWKDVGMAAGSLLRPGEETESTREVIGCETGHPLLGRCVLDNDEETLYLAKYSVNDLWVLKDHRLASGEALIPGTGYLEIARAAFAASAENNACELADFNFLAPLGVSASVPREVRTRLMRVKGEFHVEVASRRDESEEWQLHAEGTVAALASRAPAPLQRSQLEEHCTEHSVALTPEGRIASQIQHVDFGPRWQVLESIALGAGEALAKLRLDDAFIEDLETFELHPGLFDLCTGFAHALVADFSPDNEFFAPMSYGAVRIHAPLRSVLTSYVKLRSGKDAQTACFDVTVADADGNVLVEVDSFCVKRVQDTSVLSGSLASAPRNEKAGALEEGPLQILLREGIAPAEGVVALERVLGSSGHAQVVISSLGLEELREYVATSHGDVEGSSEASFERPALDNDFVEPRDEVESTLAKFWSELLGVDRVGIDDDFFELGGYSLIAVRLFARVRKQYGLEFALSVLFEAPTVSRLASLIRSELGLELGEEHGDEVAVERPSWTHLVPMQVDRAGAAQSDRPPFFLCAGMFGNVMNLRHLAGHIGADQPFYGLQAKGVDGKSEPHSTFEEQAAAYLEEVRQVQPSGPYFLGGFSGGGIVAYEMARQLREAGEQVGILVMLDSWVPKEILLSSADRREMHAQRFKARGLRYAWEILYNRLQRNKKRLTQIFNARMGKLRPHEFTETNIELAFRSALVAYDTPDYSGEIELFRPELDVAHELSSGNRVSSNANYVYHDNDWSRHCAGAIHVHEVPGDHDNMVLEPNVRVLAAMMRERIDEAEARCKQETAAASSSEQPQEARPTAA